MSKSGELNAQDWENWAKNGFLFVCPTLAIFFSQLAMGVSWKLALPVAALALYQSLADLFKKYNAGK